MNYAFELQKEPHSASTHFLIVMVCGYAFEQQKEPHSACTHFLMVCGYAF